MAQERMHAAQVGSALIEKERGGRMSRRMGGNYGTGALECTSAHWHDETITGRR